MADYRNERWMEKDGSIFTVREYKMRSEFGPNKTVYKVRGSVAFNVGKELALHMVASQNHYLDRLITMGVGEEQSQLIVELQTELDNLQDIEYDDLTPEQQDRAEYLVNKITRYGFYPNI